MESVIVVRGLSRSPLGDSVWLVANVRRNAAFCRISLYYAILFLTAKQKA
jgi:hypothetical protein